MQYISLWESHPDEPQFRSKAQDPAPVGYVEMVSPSDFPVRFAQVKE